MENMKRELKFRVWNGLEMIYDVTVGKFGTFYVNPSNNGLDERDSASLTPFTTKYSDAIPVMQFTGLKDKNGKEIYEGDILRGNPQIKAYPVIFDKGSFLWADEPISFGLHEEENMIIEFNPKDWATIIGNIYSNPELL